MLAFRSQQLLLSLVNIELTGEGTRLGLRLNCDILTKDHSGTLSVNSMEGQGSEFVVAFPIA